MIDRYGKEMTTTVTFEQSDNPKKIQLTVSSEACVEDMMDVIYAGLVALGYHENSIKRGMYEYATEKMKYTNCYNEYYDSYSYKEVLEEARGAERFDMRKYASSNPVKVENVEGQEDKYINVEEFINKQMERENPTED